MFIKDPSPMEDGYKSLNIRNIVDSTFAPYKTMNDFVGKHWGLWTGCSNQSYDHGKAFFR